MGAEMQAQHITLHNFPESTPYISIVGRTTLVSMKNSLMNNGLLFHRENVQAYHA
jgi:hypothetical protein